MNKFFAPDETLLASELWDFLSGQPKTMEQILDIINTIATPNFLTEFQFINDHTNRGKTEYAQKLNAWFLCSERNLVNQEITILDIIRTDRSLTRIYYKTPFDNKGNYNFNRYNELVNALQSHQ